jgi:hypothetical protein
MISWIFIGILWGGVFTGIGWSLSQNLAQAFKHVRRLHQIPCSKCIYFTDSCYLKCTVNPTVACSESAIDCRDFVKLDFKSPQELLALTPAYKDKSI